MGFVANEVKRAREAAGLSQEKLALAVGMSSSNYNKYETGKLTITRQFLERVATVVMLDLDRLEQLMLLDKEGPEKVERAALLLAELRERTPGLTDEQRVDLYKKAAANRKAKREKE